METLPKPSSRRAAGNTPREVLSFWMAQREKPPEGLLICPLTRFLKARRVDCAGATLRCFARRPETAFAEIWAGSEANGTKLPPHGRPQVLEAQLRRGVMLGQ
jgi:hypothetical protein